MRGAFFDRAAAPDEAGGPVVAGAGVDAGMLCHGGRVVVGGRGLRTIRPNCGGRVMSIEETEQAVPKTPLVKEIPPKAADLSEWYQAVCYKAELVSLAPVRGCIVLRPYGFGMWERLQAELDARFKATGHENAYFPLLIPGVAADARGGARRGIRARGRLGHARAATKSSRSGSRSGRRSEVIIGTMYADWVQSYRDLPILINQWANVMRWEKRTRPVPAYARVLWQEGHTAHATRG